MPVPSRSGWVWAPPAIALALLALVLGSGSNRPLFLLLNAAGEAVGVGVWLHLTLLGDGAVALVLMFPCIRRMPHCFWAALLAAVVAALWTQVTKQLIDMPRPLAVLAPQQFFQAGPAYRRVSFPSGHAAAAFAMAGIWIMGGGLRPALRLFLLLLASLVSLSRIMVGVHWPVDILWGMVGGWLGAWLGLAVQARWRWRTASHGGLLAGLVLLGLSATLLASRHIGIPAVMPAQRLIGCACLLWGAGEMLAMLPPHAWRPLRRTRLRQDAEGRADG